MMKLINYIFRTKRLLVECPCGHKFQHKMIEDKIQCPQCHTVSSSSWIYPKQRKEKVV